MSSLGKCLFRASDHFLIGLFGVFLLSCTSSLCIFLTSPLSDIWFAITFSHSIGCLFILLMISFAVQKLSSWYSPTCLFLLLLLLLLEVKWSEVKSLSRVRLCDPTDCNPPGSSIHGIFQARVLEWVAVSFSICFWSQAQTTKTYFKGAHAMFSSRNFMALDLTFMSLIHFELIFVRLK